MLLSHLHAIDLNLLVTFWEVAEQGGITRAAKVLHRSQSAVTVRISRLEEALGVRLFDRVARSVRLTSAGGALREDLRPLLGALRVAVERAQRVNDEPRGTLRIGALPTLGSYVLAPIIARMRRKYTDLSFEMVLRGTTDLAVNARRGEVDLAFIVGDEDVSLRSELVGEVRAVGIFPRSSRLRRRVSVKELRAQPLVTYGKTGDPFFDAVHAFYRRHDLLERVAVSVAHVQTMKALVAQGVGAAIVPQYTVTERELVGSHVSGLSLRQPVMVLSTPRVTMTTAARLVVAAVRSAMAQG